MGVHWKIWFLGGCMKIFCLKRGAWIVCRFKKGLGKKEGVMFWGGEGLRPQCTLWVGGAFLLTQVPGANNIVTQYYY